MPSHVHLIFSAKNHNPDILLGRIKEYTSKQIVKAIKEKSKVSRKEWILWMSKRAGSKSSNVKEYRFWQHNNILIELWNTGVIEQKADYLHDNPLLAGFVNEDWH